MKDRECYLCGEKSFDLAEGKVRDIPDMPILKCKNCGLIFLENFDHIDSTFYEDSRMRSNDLKKDWKSHVNEGSKDDSRRVKWIGPIAKNKSLLDFGCDVGGFLLKIREFTSDCAGVEKDRSFANILRKLGITIHPDIKDLKNKFDIITLFHVLEHLKDPKAILKKLSEYLNPSGSIIIETPNSNDALLSLYKNKPFSRFTYWGCHLYLFNSFTLRRLIEDSGLVVDYIKQIQRYPLSNHLYWLSHGKPGGYKIWNFIDTPKLTKSYEAQLVKRGICDTLIASVSTKNID